MKVDGHSNSALKLPFVDCFLFSARLSLVSGFSQALDHIWHQARLA